MTLLDNLHVVLVGTRFPENIGMAARACANMGVANLSLANPEWWDEEKARPLATAQAEPLLKNIAVFPDVHSAIGKSTLVIGTTARTGGWRREIASPAQAAQEIFANLRQGGRVSLVFGPEDRGLNNEDIQQCNRLVRIPTAEASSLNLAQAVLVLLYECRTACMEHSAQGEKSEKKPRLVNRDDMRLLLDSLRGLLLDIDFLHGDNPDYSMQPLRRLLERGRLRRHEFDMLMGICRQMRGALSSTPGRRGAASSGEPQE